MATVPPYLTPRQAPPPMPAAAALPDENAWKESVAESCCPASEAVIDGSGSGSDDEEDGCESCVDGSEGGAGKEEEEGSEVVWPWSQAVGGGGGRKDEKGMSEVVWSWSQDGGGVCFIWPPNKSSRATTTAGCGHPGTGAESDDLKAAAAARRQEEDDRKFWEVCLSTGYP